MRVVILLTLILLLTGCAPKVEAPAPEPEPEPKDEPVQSSGQWDGKFNTTVTLRHWDEATGMFLSAERMEALRQNAKDQNGTDQVRWLLKPTGTETDHPTPKSEIIDTDGTVWIVHRMERDTTLYDVCYVKKRDPR